MPEDLWWFLLLVFACLLCIQFLLQTPFEFTVRLCRILHITNITALLLIFQKREWLWSPSFSACWCQCLVKTFVELLSVQLKDSVYTQVNNTTCPKPQHSKSAQKPPPPPCVLFLFVYLWGNISTHSNFLVKLMRNLDHT